MDSIFFEKQEAALCAQHALNALLQGQYFSAVDLAEIARNIDNQESNVLSMPESIERQHQHMPASTSHNMDDTGYFSVQVMTEALRVWNLELIPLINPTAIAYRDDPTSGRAYICNHREHWFTVRRLGFQWFNLNSLLSGPQLISDTYLNLFFAQLVGEGYSIFVVSGDLPPCPADEMLTLMPIDPSIAARTDPIREDQREDPELARAIALSLQQEKSIDDKMQLALDASRRYDEANDLSLQRALNASRDDDVGDDGGNDEERQFQLALQMSMQQQQQPIVDSDQQQPPSIVDAQTLRRQREEFLKKFDNN